MSYDSIVRDGSETRKAVITTVAGNGEEGYSGDGGEAANARLSWPVDTALDSAGNLYIADRSNHRIRKVSPAGVITTVAGNGEKGSSGDGGDATKAQLSYPTGIALDSAGNLYITGDYRVRKVSPAGVITTVAGTGTQGFDGDGGDATKAQFYDPRDVAVDSKDNLYIPDGPRVRKITAAGVITTVAGTTKGGSSGDGGEATKAELWCPESVALDGAGNLYISDSGQVRKVNTAGIITTIAGAREDGSSGDGGEATKAELRSPNGVLVDTTGNLYIAERNGNRVRKVNTAGIITTVAGPTGLTCPESLAADSAGNLYVADSCARVVRKLTFSSVPPLQEHTIQAAFANAKDATDTLTLEIQRTVDGVDQILTSGHPGITFDVKDTVPYQVTVRRGITVLGEPGSVYFTYDPATKRTGIDTAQSQLPEGLTVTDSGGNRFTFTWNSTS
ncbi:NHL domain-containing protein [Streptomyces sp. NPDC003860]